MTLPTTPTLFALVLAATALTSDPAAAQTTPAPTTPAPKVSFTFGPRVGLSRYAFEPVGSRSGWTKSLPDFGYTFGAFAEAAIVNGAVRFRADLGVLTHRQQANIIWWGAKQDYRATELFLRPAVLVRLGPMPIYASLGAEISRVQSSNVRGHYAVADTTLLDSYILQPVDQPYRTAGAISLRPALGFTGIIHRRFDLSLHITWGGSFAIYAPRQINVFFINIPSNSPSDHDFRNVRLSGYQFTMAYHFGHAAAGQGAWHPAQ